MRAPPPLLIPMQATVLAQIEARAAAHPDRPAYSFLVDGIHQTSPVSYSAVVQRAHEVAALLQHRGVKPGDRVLLLYAPSLEFFWALYGCFHAGAIAVPSYPPNPSAADLGKGRLLKILADSGASWIAADSLVRGFAEPLLAAAGVEPLRWIVTDAERPQASEFRPIPIRPERVAFLQYTSGSTDAPKGVVVTHENLASNQAMIHEGFAMREGQSALSWLPTYHDMGLGTCVQALLVGASLTLMSPLDFVRRPVRWLEAMARHRIEVSGGPNFSYELCVRKISDEAIAALDLSAWELAYVGAEPIHPDTLGRFAERFASCGFRRSAFLPCYGMAEIALYACGTRHPGGPIVRSFDGPALEQRRVQPVADEASGARRLVGCGQAVTGEELAIVDPTSGARAETGGVGEIWIRGTHVCAGYYRNTEDTARTFGATLVPGEPPWLRTGDLGFLDRGELFVVGRIKDMIIVDGRNLYPQDLERAIEHAHPAVRSGCAVAFGVERDGSEQPIAVLEIDRSIDPADSQALRELTSAVRQALSSEFNVTVRDVIVVRHGTLPKTSSGKLQRAATRALAISGGLDRLDRRL